MTHDKETELPWFTRLWMSLAAPILKLLGRALLASCRIERVEGKANLAMLLEHNQPTLLCCWRR